jgi:hypothetical protein
MNKHDEIARRDQASADVIRIEQLEMLLKDAEAALQLVTDSKALKEAPFYGYCESIDRANKVLEKIQKYWR